MSWLAAHWGEIGTIATAAWGWYERRKRVKAAAAEAARQKQLTRDLEAIEAGELAIAALIEKSKATDALWRPKAK
jgi:hypothetical protein